MTLTKDNVVKTTDNVREMRRLQTLGFREMTTSGEEGDALALLTVLQLKQKLDERGVKYKPSARKAELIALLKREMSIYGDKNL